MSAPTFSLIWVKPSATACAGERDQLLVGVADPAGRGRVRRVAGGLELRDPLVPACRAARGCRAPRPGSARPPGSGSRPAARSARASCPRAAARAACPPSWRRRSQAAFTTAPIAMCMTPFSGPSHRSWLSPIMLGAELAEVADDVVDVLADHVLPQGRRSAATMTSLPRPMVKQRACALEPVRRRSAAPRRRPSSPDRGSSRPSRRARARSETARRSSRARRFSRPARDGRRARRSRHARHAREGRRAAGGAGFVAGSAGCRCDTYAPRSGNIGSIDRMFTPRTEVAQDVHYI